MSSPSVGGMRLAAAMARFRAAGCHRGRGLRAAPLQSLGLGDRATRHIGQRLAAPLDHSRPVALARAGPIAISTRDSPAAAGVPFDSTLSR